MLHDKDLVELLLDVINDIKKTAFDPETIDEDFYLGGDLGIDSREMLEVWYELEQKLDIQIHDYEKRDIYTIGEVIERVKEKAVAAA